MIHYIYPEVFETGERKYDDKRLAIADALTGWGNCQAGQTPPENFGKGMVCISKFVGEVLSPDNILEVAEKLKTTEKEDSKT